MSENIEIEFSELTNTSGKPRINPKNLRNQVLYSVHDSSGKKGMYLTFLMNDEIVYFLDYDRIIEIGALKEEELNEVVSMDLEALFKSRNHSDPKKVSETYKMMCQKYGGLA